MRTLLACAVALWVLGSGQALAACGRFGTTHRYDDDFSCLNDPAKRTGPLDSLKLIPLAPDPSVTLTIGGELRERYETVRNPDLGTSGVTKDDVFLHRLLLNADLRLGPNVRFFGQLGNHLATERRTGAAPTDENRLDLQQGFVDLSAPLGNGEFTVRAGRQEIAFGSQRLTTVREGPNVRLSFDGVRTFWTRDSIRIDAFAVRPVRLSTEAFDDDPDPGQAFWGVYGAGKLPAWTASGLDLYYLGLDRETARFDRARADERRHTLGARLFGRSGAWDWDLEAAYQFGRFGTRDIRAWTVASTVGVTLADLPWTPRLGLSADVASGDRNPNDRVLGTFNALYPRAPYFTEAAINAPANLMDLHPFIEVKPHAALTLRAGVDFMWRHSRTDAFYSQPIAPLIPGDASSDRYIGSQAEVRATWTVNPNLSLNAAYVHFRAGDFIRAGGGKDQDYGAIWTTFRF
ncbi:alginate export family protein [Bosea eneae]|uniref:Alginate export family protein n=1 Tax=Bosea eneae TaxID=151454 RepID=A0ABW0IXP2_9HYPH